ncbi:MAG: cysteine--tRNA ligase [Clostridia bacterium]|nr:cysteine--tRNA ligase [Clostridia bacterium]
MQLYNSLTNKMEDLNPKDNTVRMYACGPTVYNYFHVGNARCFVLFDLLRRYLEYRGNKVTFVQNFTDIDDKMIKRALEENTTVADIAEKYIGEYFKDAKALGITPASVHPRATENIDEIIGIISTLIEKGFAYVREGDVYFAARKFKEYGKLSGISVDDLESGARISVGDIKDDPLDFALWKAYKPGEPYWEAPWGNGRPGWHIECSAMVNKYLGNTIDIHCGGQDLTFPHHENEIAQSEAAFGVPFSRFWIHNGYINVCDEKNEVKKMSKSAGNFFTVRDAGEKFGYDAIRYFILSAHYRSPVTFSVEVLETAKNSLERLYNCQANIKYMLSIAEDRAENEEETAFKKRLEELENKFCEEMDDDFNTANGIAVIFDAVKEINIFLSAPRALSVTSLVSEFYNRVVGLMGFLKQEDESGISEQEIEALIAERAEAKKAKNYARADEIRNGLAEQGIILEDTPQGVKWKRK